MNSAAPNKTYPTTPSHALLGALPFFAYGLVSLFFHFGNSLPRPPIWLHPFFLMNTLVLIGLAVGLLSGFPRWTYSYLSWALILAWWLSDMGMYGIYHLDGRMWLLPLGVLVLALLVRRSLAPLRALIAGLRSDWTLLSLGIYAFYAWGMVLADENHHPYLPILIIGSTIAVSTGAWLYFRQTGAIQQIVSLLAGLFAMIVIGIIGNATWDSRTYYDLPESSNNVSPIGLAFLALVLTLMLLTGYFANKRLRHQ